MPALLTVMLGSALGGGFRYALAELVIGPPETGRFPWGILMVNLLGCFFLGFLSGTVPSTFAKLFWGTGVAGGFTTYSTYNAQTVALFSLSPPLAGAYLVATLTGCMVAHLLGTQSALLLARPPS